MALTPTQRTTVLAAVQADATANRYRTGGNVSALRGWLNGASTFVVYKTTESILAIGQTINYVAFEALTTANLEKINTFTRLNMQTCKPSRSDVRAFWANVFSGALGGQGQATRDALEALWRRFATNAERAFATGTGTTLAPGALVFEGTCDESDAQWLVQQG